MTDAEVNELIDVFVTVIARLEFASDRETFATNANIRYFIYPQEEGGSPYTHEFFPYDVPAMEAIQLARSVCGESPHFISAFGERARNEIAVYEAAGYEYQTEWELMVRPIAARVAEPGDERAVLIENVAMEQRILTAMLAAGSSEHPAKSGQSANPKVRQRWIGENGKPASFGQIVIHGDFAYLGAVVTVPEYRRRGHAGSIMRRLLDDGYEAGAKQCILASTQMAHGLYLGFGYNDVTPLIGFQTRVN